MSKPKSVKWKAKLDFFKYIEPDDQYIQLIIKLTDLTIIRINIK